MREVDGVLIENARRISPDIYPIENRGYGFGTGSILLPNGTQLQVCDTQAELNNVLLREAYKCWEAHLVG